MSKTTSISVRDIPVEDWQRFRAAAVLRGLSVREALVEAINRWSALDKEWGSE